MSPGGRQFVSRRETNGVSRRETNVVSRRETGCLP